MKTLREYIKEADEKGIAIGHFNISNLESLHGVYNAAKKLNVPIIIGMTEGEEQFVGMEEGVALIKALRDKDNYPIFLNGDHHYSFETVKRAIDVGYDSVIIDGAKLSLDDNIKITKKCVDYAHEINMAFNRDVLVEAELGFIGQSSKMLGTMPDGVSESTMTLPEDAKSFVEQTGVDMLAPSVGNVHGMIRSGNPRLHPEKVKEIRQACGIPLVLHGGSGTMDEDFIECIKNGIDIVHINTEIRIAYKEALIKTLDDNKEEIAPYKYLPEAVNAIEKVVEARLKLFNNIK